jgi:hypothetical protein
LRKVILITVLAVVYALALINDRLSFMNSMLNFQSIDKLESAQFFPEHIGAGGKALDLDIKNDQHKEVIAKILKWLSARLAKLGRTNW